MNGSNGHGYPDAAHSGVSSVDHRSEMPIISADLDRNPVVIFWEVTRACALKCEHCRAKAQPKRHPLELSTDESLRVMDQLTEFETLPIVVLSGGDPFMRRDIFEIAEYGIRKGLTVSLSPSATALVTRDRLAKLVDIGVRRVSFSLDGADAETHDAFRGFTGTFDRTMAAFDAANDVGLSFQVNTTITKNTKPALPDIAEVVKNSSAAIWDLFFLVPTGRGLNLDLMTADEHDEVYSWILENQPSWDFRVKTTLGQPFRRAMTLKRLMSAGGRELDSITSDEIKSAWPGPPTNDGRGIFFISHLGEIFPSGFIPVSAGNVRRHSVVEIYRNSEIFTKIRDRTQLQGKCGICPFNVICGGSRSRSYALTGQMTAADPTCRFQPPNLVGETV
ncbi:MAG: TIGR04053 family radical SAM/SPASM domain-containing protein [Chloroflexi bacterium]|nr:TIGR04053 family radical SAM/SPASM domain-containing protein [Chloroflexota bacterium]